MSDGSTNHSYIAFHYIHQNPLKANLVAKTEDWKYASFQDYSGFRNGSLCDKELACQIIGFNKDTFIVESYKIIDVEISRKIFFGREYI